MMKRFAIYILAVTALFSSCREDQIVVPTEYDIINDPALTIPDSKLLGVYIVNEGNMGSNKCSIDFLNYKTSLYERNIYAEKNPEVVMELGDVGNDIAIYGSKLYVVVNCSHKVEVMNAYTGKRIGQIDIPNCRYIDFSGNKAYVSSYVGPVMIDPDSPKGAVFEVDTTSLKVTRKVTVGYQPEEILVKGDYLYVANSGGYRAEKGYDNTLSVVEIDGMRQVEKIKIDINLHHVKADRYGRIWVNSRGDMKHTPSNLYMLERKEGKTKYHIEKIMNIPCSDMVMHGDSMYVYSTQWDELTAKNTVSYALVNLKTLEVVSSNFITDGTEKDIMAPYGLEVNPENGDIYITDARNYVSSGILHCYSSDGKRKWSVRTGDIPAHFAFLKKQEGRK